LYLGNLDAKEIGVMPKITLRMMWMILQAEEAEDWVVQQEPLLVRNLCA
jgi:GDPmannose 4,6-dehydratase